LPVASKGQEVKLDFSNYEQGIERISRQLPGMPRDRVVLNRLLFFMFKELDDVYNQHLAEFGLNSSSFLALAMLMSCDDGQLNPCDLSDALIASRTNVTRMTDELVQAGWVDRKPSTEDRRRVDLSLTEAGRALVLKVLPTVWRLVERQWADFSPHEVVEFDRLLRKLLAGLDRFRDDT
jgi:MarR family transcriptional repressor of emrRAB